MRHAVASVIALALLIAPSIADLLASRADACAVAPCCIGKMSKSCPMHSTPHGKGMRACGVDERVGVAGHTVAVFAPVQASAEDHGTAAVPFATQRIVPSSPSAPDPPPPRLS